MLQLNLASTDSIRECVREALARCGHIDVLVNNAGLMHHGFAEETTLDQAENSCDATRDRTRARSPR